MVASRPGTSLEHFAHIAGGNRWKEVFIQMLTACFDGAPKDTPEFKVLVVAGFAGFANVWDEFEQQWQKRLDADGLPYFHAGSFAHSEEPFKDGWKGDEPRRISLSSDLMGIIEGYGLRKFGCVVALDDLKQFKRDKADQLAKIGPEMDAFTLAAMRAADQFHAYALREGITHNVRCVFEKGDPERLLRAVFKQQGYQEPDFEWNRHVVTSKGFSRDGFRGLQAAGWIAYEYYLDAKRTLGFEDRKDRWAMERFEKLPGEIQIERSSAVQRLIKGDS